VGQEAQELVRRLPEEARLLPSDRLVLDYLAWRANEATAARPDGVYAAWPSKAKIARDTGLSAATLARAFNRLEYTGLHLMTREKRKDARSTLYVLHIRPADLTPHAVLTRQESAHGRQNRSQDEMYLPFEKVSPCDVNRSHGEMQIRSHDETYRAPHLLLNLKGDEPKEEQEAPPLPPSPTRGARKRTRAEIREEANRLLRSRPRAHWPAGLDAFWAPHRDHCDLCHESFVCDDHDCRSPHNGDAQVCTSCLTVRAP
jgi:AraC-like DNA-binding protein